MYQNTVHEESPVEVTTPPPKPSKRRQKRLATVRNEDVPRCTSWTNEEEIALCKGWVHVSKNSVKGRRIEELKRNTTSIRHFLNMKLNLEYRLHFVIVGRFRKKSPKWWEQVVPKYSNPNPAKKSKTFGSSSFNTESGDASFNLNVDVLDEDEIEVQEIPRTLGRDKARGSKKKGAESTGSSMNMTDEALARLMVSELATQTASAMAMKKEERAAYMEIKRREVECRE
ncbi:hypothetical protein Tco_0538660 [Tanacetum coccineum]